MHHDDRSEESVVLDRLHVRQVGLHLPAHLGIDDEAERSELLGRSEHHRVAHPDEGKPGRPCGIDNGVTVDMSVTTPSCVTGAVVTGGTVTGGTVTGGR